MLAVLLRRNAVAMAAAARTRLYSSGAAASVGESADANPTSDAPGDTTASAGPNASDSDVDVEALVTESLRQATFRGWNDATIHAAVAELGWSPAAAGMIPGGAGDLALRFVNRCNVQLARDLASPRADTSGGPIPSDTPATPTASATPTAPVADGRAERLQHAVRTRLEMVAPYHHNWGSALAQLTRPAHVRGAAVQSALLADELAFFAGYHEPQFSWYMDRAVVSALYTATELFWISDKSPGQIDTWHFVESSVERAEGLRSGATGAFNSVMSTIDLSSATLSSIVRSIRGRY